MTSKKFSDEHRRKLSEAAKRRWADPEYRKEMAAIVITDEARKASSDRMKTLWQDPEYRKNHPRNNMSESARRSISEKAKKRWSDPTYKARVAKKIGKTAKEVWDRPGYKEKMSEALKGINSGENNHMYGKHPSEETRQKMRDSHNDYQVGEGHPMWGKKHSKETRMKLSESHKGNILSEENKKNISKANKKMWANLSEEKRDEWIRNNRASQRCSPTKPERQISKLLNKLYPKEWKFVGDGAVIIAGKNPDFINVNGQKKIIECWGDYWHEGENPQDRIDVFKPYGFDTLIIWASELKDSDSVITRIREFSEVCHG